MKKIAGLSIGLVTASLLFTACGGASGEQDRFVQASVELGCLMFENPDAFNDFSALKTKSEEIFVKHGFDTKDTAAMEAIAEKFQADEDVIKAIQEGMTKCAGDALCGALTNPDTTEPSTTTTAPTVE